MIIYPCCLLYICIHKQTLPCIISYPLNTFNKYQCKYNGLLVFILCSILQWSTFKTNFSISLKKLSFGVLSNNQITLLNCNLASRIALRMHLRAWRPFGFWGPWAQWQRFGPHSHQSRPVTNLQIPSEYRIVRVKWKKPHLNVSCMGHTSWCAIGVGTFQGTLSWCGTLFALWKEGGCVDLSMDSLHLKYPLVLFGSEGSGLTLPLFLLSPRIIMLCHWSSTMTKDHFLLTYHGTKWPLCVDVPLNTYSILTSTSCLLTESGDAPLMTSHLSKNRHTPHPCDHAPQDYVVTPAKPCRNHG